jgi:hypothetical protein
MEALLQKILDTLAANGGSMTWEELMATLDYREQQRAMNAIRLGKKTGVLKRALAHNAETGVDPLRVELIVPEPSV